MSKALNNRKWILSIALLMSIACAFIWYTLSPSLYFSGAQGAAWVPLYAMVSFPLNWLFLAISYRMSNSLDTAGMKWFRNSEVYKKRFVFLVVELTIVLVCILNVLVLVFLILYNLFLANGLVVSGFDFIRWIPLELTVGTMVGIIAVSRSKKQLRRAAAT